MPDAPPQPLPDSPTPEDQLERQPALELFIDIPNFEMALGEERLPRQLLYGKLGSLLRTELPGGPYFLKRVWCFASTRAFDPDTGVGTLRDEPYVSHLRTIVSTDSRIAQVVLSHRLPPRRHGDDWVEKGVDVNLATYMMEGACDNRFDVALLLANDSDYAGLCRRVQQRGKTIIWGYLGKQVFNNDHLSKAVMRSYFLSRSVISKCKAV